MSDESAPATQSLPVYPAELIGLANIKENKWRDLSWCMEDFPAHGFGCH
jgi:hypothetical protein